jgi:hypothetical protein
MTELFKMTVSPGWAVFNTSCRVEAELTFHVAPPVGGFQVVSM